MRQIRFFIAALAIATAAWGAAAATAAAQDIQRPVPRPGVTNVEAVAAPAPAADTPSRPRARPDGVERAAQSVAEAKNRAFTRWIRSYRGRALARGIRGTVFDAAFDGVTYNSGVIRRDRNQSEFTKTLWDYLDSAVSPKQIENGKTALRTHAATLARIEATYGVDKEVVTAVWGLESAYGVYRGTENVIEALATLAYDGRRGAFFEQQLTAALQILQSGDTAPETMTGSWAGAMGHTQFIPTSYLAYAVDFAGDGQRDIWSEDPTDALASTAAYLKRFGWVSGQPWGVEVTLPQGFDYGLVSRRIQKSPSDWAALGVTGTDGQPVRNYGAASILLPAGAQGAAFMIFKNFSVIERYNTADAYVIAVGHLGDRLRGGPAIQADWPRGDRALTFAERKQMQRLLTAKGFNTKGIDGRIGPLTLKAIRGFQRSAGLIPDGYASLELLKRLQ